jgi:SAM-dependent methyltransferase
VNWHQDLYNRQIYFDLYAEEDTKLAVQQVDDLVKLVDIAPGASILDVCCGYGRHAIELARRGYQVTGIDLAPKQIDEAERRASESGVEIEFLHGDAREMSFPRQFDVTLSLFLSFGFDDDESNMRMLQRISEATAPGGVLLMDLWNREKEIRDFAPLTIEEREGGIRVEKRWEFDQWNGRLNWQNTVRFPDGTTEEWDHSVRAYTLVELRHMLTEVGFQPEKVYGDFKGNAHTLDSPQTITLSRKL